MWHSQIKQCRNKVELYSACKFPGWNTYVRPWGPLSIQRQYPPPFWMRGLPLKALLLLQKNSICPYHTAPHLPSSFVPESSGEHRRETKLSRWSLSEGPAPKGNPEFICAGEIAVPKLLQFDLKPFWPWAPCSWHSAAQTVQSQRGLRSILASHSRTGESECKLSLLDLKSQRFYFLNNRPLMEHSIGHLFHYCGI